MGRVAEPGKFAQLDRAAGARHQQPAGRLRVRAVQLIMRTQSPAHIASLGRAAALAALALLGGCGGGGGSDSPTPAPPKPALLVCDETLKTAFAPDANTTVVLAKAYLKGELLALAATPPVPVPPLAPDDVCLVKLIVGPGHSGPAGAPSTSAGIGIEIWLPRRPRGTIGFTQWGAPAGRAALHSGSALAIGDANAGVAAPPSTRSPSPPIPGTR